MKHTLEEIQHLYPFKQPLRLYEMGVSGKPEERAQKSFVQCLMAEFPEQIGGKEYIDKHGNHSVFYPGLIVATADFYAGGKSGMKQMQKYKKMGYQGGTLDIFIAYPCGGFHGFYCEMKAGRNGPTIEQRITIEQHSASGFYACIGKEFAGALWHWLQYLEGKP